MHLPPLQAEPPLVGGILVGGSSRRMGRPKALLPWQGASFLEHIAATLASVVPEVSLLGSCDELPATVARLPAIADAAGIGGPLAGILGAFAARPEAAWLVVTCDQPLLRRATLEWLIGERRPGGIALFSRLVPGRIEPFPGIFEPTALAALAALAATGKTSLQPLALAQQVRVVPVPHGLAGTLRGVNTPEEWAELRRAAEVEAPERA